jgi:hypothetical protein
VLGKTEVEGGTERRRVPVDSASRFPRKVVSSHSGQDQGRWSRAGFCGWCEPRRNRTPTADRPDDVPVSRCLLTKRNSVLSAE